MKRLALLTLAVLFNVLYISAQTPRFIFDNDSIQDKIETAPQKNRVIPTDSLARASMADSLSKIPPAMPSWRIDPRFGDRIATAMDTSFINFHNQSLEEGYDVALTYLGNIGSPAQSRIFFNRKETSLFNFLDVFGYSYKTVGKQLFIDTKQPYSNIFYQSGGSSISKEERFSGEMAISMNKKLSFGFNIDYLYARGYYAYLANKQNNFDFWTSYRTDKYQMSAFFAYNDFTNSENGGIENDGYLTGTVDGSLINTSKTQEFPTNIDNTWNKLFGSQFYLTNKYNLGYNNKNDDFIPVASIILTNNYADQRRKFYSSNPALLDYWYGKYDPNKQTEETNDKMAYWSFKNTLAISLNEGFRPWVKFGLKAFIEQDIRKYRMPKETFSYATSQDFSENSTVIGGLLSKEKGRNLRYNLSASIGVLGYNLGESKLEADITSIIKVKDKDIILSADGYIKNLKPTFYENRFNSKYYNWDNNFSDIRRVYVGGKITIPHTKTEIKGGVENIENYIYYTRNATSKDTTTILQSSKNIQVVSLQLDQKLSYKALHWDNQIVFQTSSEESIISLPKVSLYSNLYVDFKVAKVLGVQLGVDAHYFTEYYGQGYDPALLQFYNQNEVKIGNFPLVNAYVNLHLKKTRIFLMMYNIGKDFNNSQYFSAIHYPINPMIFKMGLSWNFTN